MEYPKMMKVRFDIKDDNETTLRTEDLELDFVTPDADGWEDDLVNRMQDEIDSMCDSDNGESNYHSTWHIIENDPYDFV